MRRKINHKFYISRRLYKIIANITPFFLDYDANSPRRGVMNRALEYILQYYSESEDYQKKMRKRKDIAKEFYDYVCEQDKILVENKLNIISEED